MQDPDETSEQSVTIEIAREHVDAAAMQGNVLFPIAPRGRVEPLAEEVVISLTIGLVVGLAEEAEEFLIGRKVLERRQFQPRECDVIGIQIDGYDLRRIGGEIVQDVATARRDRDETMVRLELKGFQSAIRLFQAL